MGTKWNCDDSTGDFLMGNTNGLVFNAEWVGTGWYRFTGDAGTKMPESTAGKDIL